MLNVDPAGISPVTVREVPAGQLYHFHWHTLRARGGRGAQEVAGAALGTRPDRLVIGYFVGWHMRAAVELRMLPSSQRRVAQIALSVETAWQGRGVAARLMAQTLRAARERGIEWIYLTCHALDRHPQHIAERFGARIGFEGCECVAVIAVQGSAHTADS